MHISARVDYALRALITLASSDARALTADEVALSQDLPVRFLRGIMSELRRVGMVTSQRGNDGGYRLGRPAETITVGEVFRQLEGPLAEVGGGTLETTRYEGDAVHLEDIWLAVRACLREVLDGVTIAHIVSGELPASVARLTANPEAWAPQ